MDAKNSHHYQPTARSLATDHEHVLPVLSKPAAWTAPTTTVHPVTVNNNAYYPHRPYNYPVSTPSQSLTYGPVPPPPPPSSIPPAPVHTSAQPLITESSRQDVNRNGVTKPRRSRKSNNASAGKSTLFWVHTDPQSVSEGTREETLKRIRSHVMSEHNRKKRLENTKRYKSKTWKHLAFQPVETTASSSSAVAAVSSAPSAGPFHKPSVTESSSFGTRIVSDSSSSSSASSSPEQQQKEAPQHALVVKNEDSYPAVSVGTVDSYSIDAPTHNALAPVQPATPWNYLGGAVDPFISTHTVMSDRMCRHLQHFFDLTQQAYPLQRRYGPKLRDHWTALVQQDPVSLHACICVAASNSALAAGELPLTDPNKRRSSVLLLDTFHHRGETIKLVNEGLSDPIKASSDQLIAAVSILLTIEIASGNADYLKIHLAGLRQMVGMRKTFADVPPDVRFQISWTDIRVACMAGTKPIFPFIRYARPSQLTLIPPNEDLAPLASRLIQLIEIPGIFGDAMSKTIYDLAELIWYSEWIRSTTQYREFDDDTEDYFNTEVLYVEYTLHDDRYTATGESKVEATIEGCVRLACLVFHNTVIWGFYPQIAPVFPRPVTALRLALESTMSAGYFQLCRDVLIWILFIGACSSPQLPEHTFFVNELVSVLREDGNIHSWQGLRALLLGFFYTDRNYLTPLQDLWNEVEPRLRAPQECI
ncbi:hypothetical protein ASPCADRAFT_212459 [Aspergillus carbonarius ITEM 5010]|uniref:Transcription factor domain-containing protein n=1 Tax=Aspergillus carbonarius (strain ITEM 5010) TaxID=602072 RepID=A0A1R3R5R9_ASPC5|nr:hypothetical protein ASPCADRAFT_212459 [Aspergillus carbonarius ITEM 5010]